MEPLRPHWPHSSELTGPRGASLTRRSPPRASLRETLAGGMTSGWAPGALARGGAEWTPAGSPLWSRGPVASLQLGPEQGWFPAPRQHVSGQAAVASGPPRYTLTLVSIVPGQRRHSCLFHLLGGLCPLFHGLLPAGLQDRLALRGAPWGVGHVRQSRKTGRGAAWGFPTLPLTQAPVLPRLLARPTWPCVHLHLAPSDASPAPPSTVSLGSLPPALVLPMWSRRVASWSGRTCSDAVVCSPHTAVRSGLGRPCVHVPRLTRGLLAGAWTSNALHCDCEILWLADLLKGYAAVRKRKRPCGHLVSIPGASRPVGGHHHSRRSWTVVSASGGRGACSLCVRSALVTARSESGWAPTALLRFWFLRYLQETVCNKCGLHCQVSLQKKAT